MAGPAPAPETSSSQSPRSRPTDRERIKAPRSGSGRQRHEEKITFYCTSDELLALERARLTLREYGIAADRGRIVREALSYTLAELEQNGPASVLVQRLGRDRV